MVLKNYSAEQQKPEPEWIKSIIENPAASTRLKYVAAHARSYGDAQRRFIHLLDGGLSDNLGLRGALDRAIAREQLAQIPSVPWSIPRRIALVVVDAHTTKFTLIQRTLLNALNCSVLGHVAIPLLFEDPRVVREVMGALVGAQDRVISVEGNESTYRTHLISLREVRPPLLQCRPTSLALPPKTLSCAVGRSRTRANAEFNIARQTHVLPMRRRMKDHL